MKTFNIVNSDGKTYSVVNVNDQKHAKTALEEFCQANDLDSKKFKAVEAPAADAPAENAPAAAAPAADAPAENAPAAAAPAETTANETPTEETGKTGSEL